MSSCTSYNAARVDTPARGTRRRRPCPQPEGRSQNTSSPENTVQTPEASIKAYNSINNNVIHYHAYFYAEKMAFGGTFPAFRATGAKRFDLRAKISPPTARPHAGALLCRVSSTKARISSEIRLQLTHIYSIHMYMAYFN